MRDVRGARGGAVGPPAVAMTLSAQLFQVLIQSLRAGASPGDGGSALRARRVRLGGRAAVVPLGRRGAGGMIGGKVEAVEAVARDVSPTGISLMVPLRLLRGEQLIIQLPPGDQSDRAAAPFPPLLCTVARYQPAGDGLYILGATFTRVVSR